MYRCISIVFLQDLCFPSKEWNCLRTIVCNFDVVFLIYYVGTTTENPNGGGWNDAAGYTRTDRGVVE